MTRAQEYYQRNREKLLEYSKRKYQENKESRRAAGRKWYNENREQALAANKRWMEANRDRRLGRSRKRRYGISESDFKSMLEKQGHKCACCGGDKPTTKWGWHVDHCHATGKVRGILCHHCNVAIGCARDSPDRLRKMALYLDSHLGFDPKMF
jgi:hypothetical protein